MKVEGVKNIIYIVSSGIAIVGAAVTVAIHFNNKAYEEGKREAEETVIVEKVYDIEDKLNLVLTKQDTLTEGLHGVKREMNNLHNEVSSNSNKIDCLVRMSPEKDKLYEMLYNIENKYELRDKQAAKYNELKKNYSKDLEAYGLLE